MTCSFREPEAGAGTESSSTFFAPGARVVELGGAPLAWIAFPDATDFFCTTSTKGVRAPERGLDVLTPFTWRRLARALSSPELALVVVQVNRHAAWSPRKIARSVFHRRIYSGDVPTFSHFGPHLVGRPAAPIAAVDRDDVPLIMPHNFALLDRAAAYFMRELPLDRWRAFMTTGHHDLPPPRLRRLAKWRRRIEKLHPVPLGLPSYADPERAPHGFVKTTDVFFAGTIGANSWLRERGAAELRALSDEGVRLDIVDERIGRDEFYLRSARAWLTWSPEGLGHDCFRHYEAAMCGSVPVISRAPIERYRPLVGGEHAFYYDIEPGGLASTIRRALSDRDRLAAMAGAARGHVLAHHTQQAIARYVIATTLAAAR